MNPSSLPPIQRRSSRRIWLWALLLVPLLLMAVLLVTVAATVASLFHLGSDARALRDGLMQSSGVEWRQNIAVNANSLTLGAARAGLFFVKLDPGARAGLQSVRSASVGVYQMASGTHRPDRAAMFASADSVMTARGWQRVVGVMDGRNLVAVYLPAKNISVHRLKCCVMVFDGRQMVLVSARGNPEPILTYALYQPGIGGKANWLAQR